MDAQKTLSYRGAIHGVPA